MPAAERNMWFDYLLEYYIDQSYNHIFLETMHSNFTCKYSLCIELLLSFHEIIFFLFFL